MEPLIQLKNIVKTFSNGDETVTALNDINLSIYPNDFIAFMGSSGSGKSTLMNVLGCLDAPSSGHYLLNGDNVSGLSDEQLSSVRNQKIGFIFQTFHLLPKLSAIDNVRLPLRYAEVSEKESKERAIELLHQVGLSHRMEHKPFEMSGGQRQRVAIARALINRPSIILADEPTGNLDSKTSEEIMALLTKLHREGQTIIMVTHEDEIAEHAQHVVRMKDGEIITRQSKLKAVEQ